MRDTLVAATLAWAVCAAASAETPRTPHGAPDLEGLWSNASLTSFTRPDELKTLVVPDPQAAAFEAFRRGKPPKNPTEDAVGGTESEWWETDVGLARIRGEARSSWIVSPADGQFPFTEAAKAANKARGQRLKSNFDHPEGRPLGERCLSTEASGPPLMNGGYNDNYQFVQTPDTLLIVAEYMHDVRIVRIGGERRLPPSVRVWGGESVGRWEGETLVVETTNFTPAEVLAPDGDPSADMKTIERFTRIGPQEILYTFRIEHPTRFTQPVEGEMVLTRTRGPLFEFACHEANYSLPSILSGARQAETTGKAGEKGAP